MHSHQHPLLQEVSRLSQTSQAQVLLVGGAVRDWLRLETLSKDLDLMVVNGSAAELAKQMADGLGGHLVPLDWEFGIHRVVLADGVTLDFSEALQNDLQKDLARRDLTVNAMAIDLTTGELHDPFKGQADLKAGIIRMVSEANLLDDPLRLIRVFRIAATIQAQAIDPTTFAVVQEVGPEIWKSAAERIQAELLKLLDTTPCFVYLEWMAASGLLEIVLPDLAAMRQIPASGYHHLGLFEHTLELVRQAERLLPECPAETRDWVNRPFNQAISRFSLLKLACLLHDIGKPSTMGTREDEKGTRLTFYRHEEVGEDMADVLLKRLKFSNDAQDYVKKLIRWHLYPCQFGPDSPRKSILRFYRRLGDETIDTVVLALADRFSSQGPYITEAELNQAHQHHLWLLQNYQREVPTLKLPRLLNGHEVMEILQCPPGPHLKEILDALQEAQQLGEVTTPEEAKNWLLKQPNLGA